jgi:exodeoxyribonuclease III
MSIAIKNFEKNPLKLYSWNVNGIRACLAKEGLQNFLKTYDPEVLCVNEIKIDHETLTKSAIEKQIPKCYHQYYNCCKTRRGYSGTAVFTKGNFIAPIIVKPLNVTFGLGIEKHDGEGRLITCEFKKVNLLVFTDLMVNSSS